jgi:putative endopeptidase
MTGSEGQRNPSTNASGTAEAPPRIPRISAEFIDPTADPGRDFYRYAAGRWVEANPVPSDKSRWGAFDELLERNFYLIHQILERAASDRSAPAGSPTRLIGDFYASAMDTDRRDALRLGPIAEPLDRVAQISSMEELYRVLGEFHRSGVDGLFETYAYPDKRNSAIYGFYLEQGGLSLPDRDYYLEPRFEEARTAFRGHLLRSFRLLGEEPAAAAADAESVLALETELAKASRTRTELRDEEKNYHRRELAEFVAGYPTLPWSTYLAARALPPLPYVILGQPEFFEAEARVLAGHPLAAWKTYLRWQVLKDAAPFLHAEAEDAHFDFFYRTLRGQPEPEPRWKRAAYVIDATLGEALGQLYVAEHFPPEARDRMRALVEDLTEVFRERLGTRDWMSPETRRRALQKFQRFTAKIGHPEVFRDYSSIRIDRGDYLGNVRRARAFEIARRAARIGGPVDRTEWEMTPPTVNAYFSPVKNEIVFPAGILQPPFFDLGADDAVNYGVIGAIIGHEITHGYDDQGRKYDADGNLADWWTESDAREFAARAQAIVQQYNAYEPLPGEHVNGELTLGENLADLGGLRIAFEALQRRLAKDPSRRRVIDGLTPEQRFFIAWAQGWRQNCRPAETKRRLSIDPHAPGEFRAAGPPANMEEFGRAFGLGEDAPSLRPRGNRVTVW